MDYAISTVVAAALAGAVIVILWKVVMLGVDLAAERSKIRTLEQWAADLLARNGGKEDMYREKLCEVKAELADLRAENDRLRSKIAEMGGHRG